MTMRRRLKRKGHRRRMKRKSHRKTTWLSLMIQLIQLILILSLKERWLQLWKGKSIRKMSFLKWVSCGSVMSPWCFWFGFSVGCTWNCRTFLIPTTFLVLKVCSEESLSAFHICSGLLIPIWPRTSKYF